MTEREYKHLQYVLTKKLNESKQRYGSNRKTIRGWEDAIMSVKSMLHQEYISQENTEHKESTHLRVRKISDCSE